MANLPISGLPVAAALAAANLTVIVQGGVTVQSTVGAFASAGAAAAQTAFNLTRNNATNAAPTAGDDSTLGYAVGSRWTNTDTGWVYVCRSAAVGAAVWSLLAPAGHPGYLAGRYYPMFLVTVSNGSALTNQIHFVAFAVNERITIDELGIRIVTASAGGNFQLGLWAGSVANMLPAGLPLAVTANTLSTAVAGANVTGALSAAVTLEPGVFYWVAVAADNIVVTFQTIVVSASYQSYLIGGATIGTYNNATANVSFVQSAAFAYAGNMNTFNAPGALAPSIAVRGPFTQMHVLSVP